jgi:hypothetical protein
MKTTSGCFQCVADFGNVNGASFRCVYIILRFGYKPGTCVQGSSAVPREGAHKAYYKGLDDRTPKKIRGMGRRGVRFTLNVTHDSLEPSPYFIRDARMGVTQALSVPERRIGQTVLAAKHQ